MSDLFFRIRALNIFPRIYIKLYIISLNTTISYLYNIITNISL
uniref:Uncharacterized protein n=1 Tax=Anguilla anguilla TaxID=7936 RepID=A0A0E9SRV8_ANGAN